MSGSVLRSDLEVALSEVYRAALHAAHTCRRSAERAEGELSRELGEHAALCEGAAARARREIEAHGDEPSEPDPDREDLENLVRAARTALSPHPEQVLVHDAVAALELLLDASRAAREVGELGDGARAWLLELESAAAAAAQRLRDR